MHGLTLFMVLLAAAPTHHRPPSPFPVLDKDARLKEQITISGPNHTIGEVLSLLARKAEVQIIAQGDYLLKPLASEVKEQEVRDVMVDLARVTRGTWLKRGDVYLLVEPGEMAALFQWGGSTRQALEATHFLALSLTPAQVSAMQEGRHLRLADLSPEQQRAFTIAFNMEYYENVNLYPKEVFVRETGAEIALVRREENGAPQTMLALSIRKLTPKGISPISLPFLLVEYPPQRR